MKTIRYQVQRLMSNGKWSLFENARDLNTIKSVLDNARSTYKSNTYKAVRSITEKTEKVLDW